MDGDEARLRQVLANLLGNARVHTPPGTTVCASGRVVASSVVVEVRDDGVGLASGAVPGVGLRSMRERAEELGGTCTVVRGEGGAGTTVVATLPLQREQS